MTLPATLGSALEASSAGIAKARRSMGDAADRIASFGQAVAPGGEGAGSAGDIVGDILQISQAATAIKANVAVARIADQAISEIVSLGAKLDRKV